MIDLSTIKEPQIVISKDGKTAVKYTVVKETIDLEALRQEKEALEQQLAMPEPTKEELIELGKGQHPYYQDKTYIRDRIEQINKILGE